MKLTPVHDPKTGEVQLYDMYIDGEWHGSCRTGDQCQFYYNQFLNPPKLSEAAEQTDEDYHIVDCTVCGKKVIVFDLNPGRKWHGFITGGHYFDWI